MMGRHADKPWMKAPSYNDPRFTSADEPNPQGAEGVNRPTPNTSEERTLDDVESLIARVKAPRQLGRKEEFARLDTQPVDYAKGPHETEFDLDGGGAPDEGFIE